jgi:hypothetical protein
LETKDIILSIFKSNAICLGINYTLYFFIRRIVKTDESLIHKQANVTFFCTFLNGYITGIFTQGMALIAVISGISYVVFDNMIANLLLIIVDKNDISTIVAEYKYNLYGSRENAILSTSYFIFTILLSIIGLLVYLGMSYLHK